MGFIVENQQFTRDRNKKNRFFLKIIWWEKKIIVILQTL